MDLCSSFSLNTLRSALWALPKHQQTLNMPGLTEKKNITFTKYGSLPLFHSKIFPLRIHCTPLKWHDILDMRNPQNDHIYKLWTFFSLFLSKNIFLGLGSNVRFQKRRLVLHMWGGVALDTKVMAFSTSLSKTFSMDWMCASKRATSPHMCGTSKPWDIKVVDLSFSFSPKNFPLQIQCVLHKRLLHPTCVRLQNLENKKQWTFPPFFLSKVSPADPMCAAKRGFQFVYGRVRSLDIHNLWLSPPLFSKIHPYGSNVCLQKVFPLRICGTSKPWST